MCDGIMAGMGLWGLLPMVTLVAVLVLAVVGGVWLFRQLRGGGFGFSSHPAKACSVVVAGGVPELADGGEDVAGGALGGIEFDDAVSLSRRGVCAADSGQVREGVVDEQGAAAAVHALDPERGHGGRHVISSTVHATVMVPVYIPMPQE